MGASHYGLPRGGTAFKLLGRNPVGVGFCTRAPRFAHGNSTSPKKSDYYQQTPKNLPILLPQSPVDMPNIGTAIHLSLENWSGEKLVRVRAVLQTAKTTKPVNLGAIRIVQCKGAPERQRRNCTERWSTRGYHP